MTTEILTIQFRRGTSAEWTEENPILRAGEPGYVLDNGLYKIGDGTTPWVDLDYVSGGGGEGGVTAHALLTGLNADDHPHYLNETRHDALDHSFVEGTPGPEGPAGPGGADGNSAYQVAVNEGFGGTEQQWLDSLVGPAGATGPQGPQGVQGLQGPAGNDGAQGAQGIQGPAGEDGADGAIGPQGPAGADGADGSGVEVKGSDTYANIIATPGPVQGDMWIQTDSGGGGNPGDGLVWDGSQWTNVGPIRGPEGPQGSAGSDGSDGAQGPQGIQGPAGNDGADGATGAQGPSGSDGADGDSAYQVAVNEGFGGDESAWLTSLVGPQGPAGADGSDGATGAQGPAGNDGSDGATGPQGPAGTDGTNGTNGADGQDGIPITDKSEGSRNIDDPTNEWIGRYDIIDDASATANWPDRLSFRFGTLRTGWFNEYGEIRARAAKDSTIAMKVHGRGSGHSTRIFQVLDDTGGTETFAADKDGAYIFGLPAVSGEADGVTKIVKLTQTEYDAIVTKDANTQYNIVGA